MPLIVTPRKSGSRNFRADKRAVPTYAVSKIDAAPLRCPLMPGRWVPAKEPKRSYG
jgi:hypothetical protein